MHLFHPIPIKIQFGHWVKFSPMETYQSVEGLWVCLGSSYTAHHHIIKFSIHHPTSSSHHHVPSNFPSITPHHHHIIIHHNFFHPSAHFVHPSTNPSIKSLPSSIIINNIIIWAIKGRTQTYPQAP